MSKLTLLDAECGDQNETSYSLPARLLERYGNGERLLVPEEVAVIFQISEDTLRRWRSAGDGPPHLKFGRGRTAPVRYRLDDILRFIEQAARNSTCDPGAG